MFLLKELFSNIAIKRNSPPLHIVNNMAGLIFSSILSEKYPVKIKNIVGNVSDKVNNVTKIPPLLTF